MEGNRTCSECWWWKQVDFEDVEQDGAGTELMAFGLCTGEGLRRDGTWWKNCNNAGWYRRLREDAHACPNFEEEER